MAIELSPEDKRTAEEWVAAGRFGSVEEVVHVSMQNLRNQQEWNEYASERIEAGLADIEAGRTRSSEDVLAMLASFQQKQA